MPEKSQSFKPVFRKPVPDGVVEMTGFHSGESSALVELQDGSLVLTGGNGCRISKDGGRTWGERRSFELEALGRAQGSSCIRQQSGELALVFRDENDNFQTVFSSDEGKNWRDRSAMNLF